MRKIISFLICCLFLFTFPTACVHEWKNDTDMPLEKVISRRMSIRSYLKIEVPWHQLSKVLWAAYGYSSRGRTVPTLSENYSILIYVLNATAVYKFVPENQTLNLWKMGDYREVGGGCVAPIQLYISLDTNICPDIKWGNAEAGCVIQNIYLMANALNLGTVCQGAINRTLIHQVLGLPENEEVLYKMPLGYPSPPYTDYQNLIPTNRPSSPELPKIQDSNVNIEYALDSAFSSHEWNRNPITPQELSQVLWAGYGYSYFLDNATSPPKRHRTVPSAYEYYPMIIYAANSSGVYEYSPYTHTITLKVAGDRRANIASASGHAWASSAPLIIITLWNESKIRHTVDATTLNFIYCEVGLITQNIYLESATWGLIADWGKADSDEEAVRTAIGLTGQTNLHPTSIIAVGHPSKYLHKVVWNGVNYNICIATNSTVSNFTFDQPKKQLNFNVTGPTGTIGFCNVTIPKDLLGGPYTILLDNSPITPVEKTNATHTFLYFTYAHSTHSIKIMGTTVIPEFTNWMIMTFIMVGFSLIIFYLISKLKNVLLAKKN